MKIKWKSLIVLVVFSYVSLWAYPMILGYWAALAIPAFSSLPRNKVVILTCMSLGSAIGAFICAFILAFPMGYFTRQRPIILGSALGIIGTLINFSLYPALLEDFNWFVGTITIVEHTAFVAGCILFTVWGCRVGSRKLRNG